MFSNLKWVLRLPLDELSVRVGIGIGLGLELHKNRAIDSFPDLFVG